MTDEVKPYPLMTDAIRRGKADELESLFQRFPNFVGLEVPGFGDWLIYACHHGNVSILEFLVDAGFDVNKLNRDGDQAPLESAASAGKVDNVDFLLRHGAMVRTDSARLNPLFGAILGKSLEAAARVVDAGIDTSKRYILGAKTNPPLDAVAFAMLHGQREIAHLIALKNASGNEAIAQAAMAEGLQTAEQATSK